MRLTKTALPNRYHRYCVTHYKRHINDKNDMSCTRLRLSAILLPAVNRTHLSHVLADVFFCFMFYISIAFQIFPNLHLFNFLHQDVVGELKKQVNCYKKHFSQQWARLSMLKTIRIRVAAYSSKFCSKTWLWSCPVEFILSVFIFCICQESLQQGHNQKESQSHWRLWTLREKILLRTGCFKKRYSLW